MADKTPPKPAQEKRGGWLSRFAPGVRKIVSRRETPDNLWVKDPDSGEMLYRSDLEAALWVTPSGRHMRINATQRLGYTFDDGEYEIEILADDGRVVELTYDARSGRLLEAEFEGEDD